MKRRILITVDPKILKRFRKACKSDGAKVSTKIESLMLDYVRRYKFNFLKV